MDDLAADRVELTNSVVEAGPMACDADTSSYLQRSFPAATPAAEPGVQGKRATPTPAATPGPGAGIDPFDHTRPAWDICGVLTGPTLQHDLPQTVG
ncbi:hypothetical protein GXW82_25365 [Streptacidiphilus sp. 4-A2]|nr:hypothetical protein [Streptacidiphilus sp. 4-A2]